MFKTIVHKVFILNTSLRYGLYVVQIQTNTFYTYFEKV